MRWLPLVALIACTSTACTSEPPVDPKPGGPQSGPPAGDVPPAAGAKKPADGAGPPAGGPSPADGPPPPGGVAEDAQAPAGHAPVPGTATPPDPGEEDPRTPRYVVGAATEAAGSWEAASFQCCKEAVFTPVVSSFAELTSALAAEDQAKASAAATALNQAISAAKVSDAADEPAKAELEKLGTATAALDGADLASMRRTVADLSDTVLIFGRARAGGETSFAGAYCADTDKVWLQGSAEMAYPYGDSPDKPCGEFR